MPGCIDMLIRKLQDAIMSGRKLFQNAVKVLPAKIARPATQSPQAGGKIATP